MIQLPVIRIQPNRLLRRTCRNSSKPSNGVKAAWAIRLSLGTIFDETLIFSGSGWKNGCQCHRALDWNFLKASYPLHYEFEAYLQLLLACCTRLLYQSLRTTWNKGNSSLLTSSNQLWEFLAALATSIQHDNSISEPTWIHGSTSSHHLERITPAKAGGAHLQRSSRMYRVVSGVVDDSTAFQEVTSEPKHLSVANILETGWLATSESSQPPSLLSVTTKRPSLCQACSKDV